MGHRFDPKQLDKLVSARRQAAVRPRELLRQVGLGPGQTVLDLGCGAGFFTLPAAELVGPTGRVLALDIQPEMVQATSRAAAAASLSNVEVFLTREYELPAGLPACDWVILAYVLHEVDAPERLLALAGSALGPAGRLLILEWPKEASPQGPPLAERLGPEELAPLYQPLGLKQTHYITGGAEYYALILARSS